MSNPSLDPSAVLAAVDESAGLPPAERVAALEAAAADLESALRDAEE